MLVKEMTPINITKMTATKTVSGFLTLNLESIRALLSGCGALPQGWGSGANLQAARRAKAPGAEQVTDRSVTCLLYEPPPFPSIDFPDKKALF